jgi:hypothetical protein
MRTQVMQGKSLVGMATAAAGRHSPQIRALAGPASTVGWFYPVLQVFASLRQAALELGLIPRHADSLHEATAFTSPLYAMPRANPLGWLIQEHT